MHRVSFTKASDSILGYFVLLNGGIYENALCEVHEYTDGLVLQVMDSPSEICILQSMNKKVIVNTDDETTTITLVDDDNINYNIAKLAFVDAV